MAQIMRAVRSALGPVARYRSLLAKATAATILGLRATRAASQRFGLPPFLTTQRITLIAPTISNRLGVSPVVRLVLHKRHDESGGHQPNLMAMSLRNTAPMMRRGVSFHDHHASGLTCRQRCPFRQDNAVQPNGADLEASLRQINRQNPDVNR